MVKKMGWGVKMLLMGIKRGGVRMGGNIGIKICGRVFRGGWKGLIFFSEGLLS